MNRIAIPGVIISEVLILLSTLSCETEIVPPAVGKPVISKISVGGATAESLIIYDGGSHITECGFCWNTTGNPTIADFSVEADKAEGRFSCILDSLADGTKYYIRSYARNRLALSYGLVATFTTVAFKLPAVYSPYITYVTHNTVVCSDGRISSDNSYNILSKGICWSTSKNPTINDSNVDLGSGFGSIGYKIEGLMPGTVYYFRAYATNVVGTTYGGNLVARTFDGYTTDYEGHIYSTVRLGKQEWMNRNLETRYFSNGDWIGTTGTPTLNTEQEGKPLYQWAFNYHEDHPELLAFEGRLYTWYTATDSRKICPAGWHLPSIAEWNELLVHLGGDALTTRDFKWSFNYYWDSMLNTGATEGSFNAQLVGFRTVTGQFQYGSNYGTYWWSATEATSANSYTIYCRPADLEKVTQTDNNKKNGFSVRCVKD
jgi:uncharacterized protein (TIGR02145 family)